MPAFSDFEELWAVDPRVQHVHLLRSARPFFPHEPTDPPPPGTAARTPGATASPWRRFAPWINLDGQASRDGSSLAGLLDELGTRTDRRVRAVRRTASVGLLLLAVGPRLAWLPIELLQPPPGPPIYPLLPGFSRRSYRNGFPAQHWAERHAPFRMLHETVREPALKTGRRMARSDRTLSLITRPNENQRKQGSNPFIDSGPH